MTAENIDSAAEEDEPVCWVLPRRRVGDRHRMQMIRCMDDPEILERVLEGLVKLA